MPLLEKHLYVKKSTIPAAGKGLFTKIFIPKGVCIVEYKGVISSWNEVKHNNGKNGYIYYVNRHHVINAAPFKNFLARYANDAKGIKRVKGVSNNCSYVKEESRVFIKSFRDIPAGAEILVGYGKEYWDAIRYNMKLMKQKKR
jgi:SET domain-containing protein